MECDQAFDASAGEDIESDRPILMRIIRDNLVYRTQAVWRSPITTCKVVALKIVMILSPGEARTKLCDYHQADADDPTKFILRLDGTWANKQGWESRCGGHHPLRYHQNSQRRVRDHAADARLRGLRDPGDTLREGATEAAETADGK